MESQNRYLNLALKIHSNLDDRYKNFINENKNFIFNHSMSEYDIISESLLVEEKNDKSNLFKSKIKNDIYKTKIFLETYDFEYNKLLLKDILIEYKNNNFELKNHILNIDKNLHLFLSTVSRNNSELNINENIDKLKLENCREDLHICGTSLSTYKSKYLIKENNNNLLLNKSNPLSNEIININEGLFDWLKSTKLGKVVASAWKSVVGYIKDLSYKIGQFFKGCTIAMTGVGELRDIKEGIGKNKINESSNEIVKIAYEEKMKFYNLEEKLYKTTTEIMKVEPKKPEDPKEVKESTSLLQKLANWFKDEKNFGKIVNTASIISPFGLLQFLASKVPVFVGLKNSEGIKENYNYLYEGRFPDDPWGTLAPDFAQGPVHSPEDIDRNNRNNANRALANRNTGGTGPSARAGGSSTSGGGKPKPTPKPTPIVWPPPNLPPAIVGPPKPIPPNSPAAPAADPTTSDKPWWSNWIVWVALGAIALVGCLIAYFKNKKPDKPEPPPKPTTITEPVGDGGGNKGETEDDGGIKPMQTSGRKGLFGRILDMLANQSDERLYKAFQRYASDPDAERQLNTAIDRFGPQEGLLRFVRQHEYNEELIRDFSYVLNRLPAGDLEYLGLSGGGSVRTGGFGGGTGTKTKGLSKYKFAQLIKIAPNSFKLVAKNLKKDFESNLRIIADQIQDKETKREFKKEIRSLNLFDIALTKFFKEFGSKVNDKIGNGKTGPEVEDEKGNKLNLNFKTSATGNALDLVVENFNKSLKIINLLRTLILNEAMDKTAKQNATSELITVFTDVLNDISIEDVVDEIIGGTSLGDDEPAYQTLASHLESLFNSFSEWIVDEKIVKRIVNKAVVLA